MKLYEEIIFLDNYFDGKWIVENVIGFYEPLVEPLKLGRHYLWSNFDIPLINVEGGTHQSSISEMAKHKGFDIEKINCKHRKDTILRNCVEQEIGLHILECVKSVDCEPDGGKANK